MESRECDGWAETDGDPRWRQGKRYCLSGVIGMLLLAALYGETSLREMWLWECGQWERLCWPLELWGAHSPPRVEQCET
jgi:hypothetical protein